MQSLAGPALLQQGLERAPVSSVSYMKCSCSTGSILRVGLRTHRHPGAVHVRPLSRVEQKHIALCSTTTTTSPAGPHDIWLQVELLQRQQELAVAGEEYSRAAALRDELAALTEQLAPVEQYLLAQRALLYHGSEPQKKQAIRALGSIGDDRIVGDLAACLRSPALAPCAEAAMWEVWLRHSDPEVNAQMAQGCVFMAQRAQLGRAKLAFDDVVRRAPGYAEGYNKRATVAHMMGHHEASIRDCMKTLELQPWHYAALAGMGMCHMALDQPQPALDAFERALAVHPGLSSIRQYATEMKRRLLQK